MRLPPLSNAELPPDLQSLESDMQTQVREHLKGFVSHNDDGALIGPFPPMLHFPQFGRAAWDFTKALIEHASLPKAAHEVAILVTGARFNSRYELYAHEQVAQRAGLSSAKIATIAAGQRPADLTPEEAAAYDVASALVNGKSLPETTYRRALDLFGKDQLAELVYLVGGYCQVSILLNAYDVPVPDRTPTG